MLSLTYTNKVMNTTLEFGNNAPLFFLSQKGMDSTEIETLAVKSPMQLGKTLTEITANERLVTIKACLVTDSLADEEALRKKIISCLNPLHTAELTIQGESFRRKFSDIHVIQGPVFDDKDYNTPDGILYFDFTLCAPSVFLEDAEAYSFSLYEVIPGFSFELVFDGDICFGDISGSTERLNNKGDIDAPLIIQIPGPVQTPMLTNLTTGEFIKIYSPIYANEKMTINTAFGNKSVIITDDRGFSRNAFNYIDLKSTFFMLRPGENVLQFQAEVGNSNAAVDISFKTLFLGI